MRGFLSEGHPDQAAAERIPVGDAVDERGSLRRVTYDEFVAGWSAFLFDEWAARLGWSRDAIRGFFQHGIAIEHARAIENVSGGRFPVSMWPKLLHPPGVLHNREQSGNNSDVTRKHHALAIAKGRAKGDEFRAHITGRGFSQNRLAKKVGCSVAALSRYRDDRPIPQTIANRIQAATEWPADAEHWPGGIA